MGIVGGLQMSGHLVMLHGLTGTAEMIHPLAEKLCPSGWQVCVIDAPIPHYKRGYAWWIRDEPASSPLDSETLNQLVESVNHVLDSLPKDGPLIVGGFSQGAAIAQELMLTEVAHRILGVLVIASKVARPLLLMEGLAENPPLRMLSMHGDRDHIVPLYQAEECVELYEKAGWDVTRIRHSKGHMVDMSSLDKITEWMLITSQR